MSKEQSQEPSCGCMKPEMLKSSPEKCSPETIRQCHGDQPSHPCTPDAKESAAEGEHNA
ncbi:hypothetical protein INT08_01265 [Prosthecochloris sp. N3]|uniref:Uncharacterized protein n=1 Tax=Prosthecochloris ethylica TaxID=2743976 RepID=A0ABR9XPJ9_9CHLB|nr:MULTISPECIES: hypothetical protein [Prosthecochloris]MBF0585902.1 hypothetical protein [Prosthecochloris ethylica]MBF0635812.1 hypothetical protein [Prosthecochloris ethylica]MEC9486398.1 hypothetical protein [Prosthecochloris sp.]NUK47110.1 hypothetical protein [Prosthecochloris ethylica]